MWEHIAKCLLFELWFLEIPVFSTGDWEPESSRGIWMHISWVLHEKKKMAEERRPRESVSEWVRVCVCVRKSVWKREWKKERERDEEGESNRTVFI